MTDKIVPESVVPQNIAACLMEDNPTIPELDAFTFLNRVRALGIGSADFLYLLKGCGAPEEAIEKIESNPAMNLQSLIVTLDRSGLTSKDYTRMLYTARQMWERTLTMQISDLEDEEEEHIPSPAEIAEETDNDEYEDITDSTDSENETDDQIEGSDEITENDKEETVSAVHTGKIAAAAIGACVLLGLSGVMNFFDLTKPSEPVINAHYAADHTEIFSNIYTAYTAGKLGGENTFSITPDDSELFGKLMIKHPQELGVHSFAGSAAAAEKNRITIYNSIEDALVTKAIISPPEGAHFVEVFTKNDKLYAIFSDSNNAGFTAFDSSGKALFSMHQAGVLTDIAVDDTGISLGTVYIPDYNRSFTIDDLEEYMPVIYLDGKGKVLPAYNIALTDSTNGCGYAVYGKYDPETGAALRTAAILGDPVYSDADNFMAVMKNESGYDIISGYTDGEELTAAELTSVSACDMGDKEILVISEDTDPTDSSTPATESVANVIATAEKDENGADIIYLRGHDMEPISAIVNIPSEISALRLDGDTLYVYGENGVQMAADISDPKSPALIEFTDTYGITKDGLALCGEVSDKLVRFTLYQMVDNEMREINNSSKIVNAVGEAPALGGGNTFYIESAERCAAAYTYFDGVSVVSEFALFGKSNTAHTLFDDKTGFTSAALINDQLHLIYDSNSIIIK